MQYVNKVDMGTRVLYNSGKNVLIIVQYFEIKTLKINNITNIY